MTIEEIKSLREEISSKKRELMMMRVKLSAGESVELKEMKKLKKDVARLFTKLNASSK